jgi:cyclopropane fatty-acyl-phospholipid synthase-like methyltransferase
MAYRVLYHMLTNETADFIEVFKKITADMMSDPAIVHSMKLREAWSSDNYSKFFRLYKVTPNCGRHLVELFIDRERKSALRIMTKAYRPTLCVNYISSVLSFPSLSECQDFLSSCDLVMDHSKSSLNCRDSYSKLTS